MVGQMDYSTKKINRGVNMFMWCSCVDKGLLICPSGINKLGLVSLDTVRGFRISQHETKKIEIESLHTISQVFIQCIENQLIYGFCIKAHKLYL